MKSFVLSLLFGLGLMLGTHTAMAQTAPAPTTAVAEAKADAPAAAAPAAATAQAEATKAPEPNKGDTTWMMVATLLVIMMAIPGLALFYGGLVRSKNMLSVLMQVMV
ncbi:MAG: ammonia channel protein, partial [Hylemonella sp.]